MIFSKQHQGSPLQPSPAPKLFFTECCADWINLAKFTISLHEKREESVIVLGQTTWGRRPSNFRSNCGIALRSPSLLWTGRLTLSCTLFVLFHSSHCIRFTLFVLYSIRLTNSILTARMKAFGRMPAVSGTCAWRVWRWVSQVKSLGDTLAPLRANVPRSLLNVRPAQWPECQALKWPPLYGAQINHLNTGPIDLLINRMMCWATSRRIRHSKVSEGIRRRHLKVCEGI